MCNISPEFQAILDPAFATFCARMAHLQRSNFTAYDFVRAAKLEIPRPIVSRWLQDRFNHGGMLGWASMITQEGGPVLYFQVTASSPAGKRAEKINSQINGTAAQVVKTLFAPPTQLPASVPA